MSLYGRRWESEWRCQRVSDHAVTREVRGLSVILVYLSERAPVRASWGYRWHGGSFRSIWDGRPGNPKLLLGEKAKKESHNSLSSRCLHVQFPSTSFWSWVRTVLTFDTSGVKDLGCSYPIWIRQHWVARRKRSTSSSIGKSQRALFQDILRISRDPRENCSLWH